MLNRSALRPIPKQFREYTRSIGWVLRDAMEQHRPRMALITVLNLLGVLSGAASLGGIVLLAKHAGYEGPLNLGPLTFQLSTSVTSLIGYAAVLAIIGMMSGVCLFAADALILHVTAACEKRNIERVAAFINDPIYRGWSDLLDSPLTFSLTRLVSSGARFSAYVVRDLLRLILPALTVLFSIGMLLWIDVWITLGLVPIVIAYLIPLYRINFGVSKLQAQFRQLSGQSRKSAAKAWRAALKAGESAAVQSSQTNDAEQQTQRDKLRNLHYRRMLTPKRVQFLNTLFTMLCLLALVVYFTAEHRIHGRPWADLLVYVVALRFAASGVRQVSGIMAKISRYLPEYRSYVCVADGAARIAQRRKQLSANPVVSPRALTIKIGSNAACNSPRRITMTSGQFLWVIVPLGSRFSVTDLGAIATRIENRLVEPFDFAGRAQVIVGNHAPIRIEHPSADSIDRSPLVISTSAHSEVASTIASIVESIGDRFTVLVDHDLCAPLQKVPGLADQHVAGVLVLDGRRIIGGGELDWLRNNFEQIDATVKALNIPEDQRDQEDEDDEDDFDQ